MRAFPERFDFAPVIWKGRRARSFDKRADAFQCLVGAVLQEEFGYRVNQMPTEGRDGGIDTYICTDVLNCNFFPPLKGPIIVESKDNDDRAGRALKNIIGAWKKVEGKLRREAARGWTGLYAPWTEARSYIYVTSARLPHRQARTSLETEIKDFFKTLRTKKQTQIRQVHIVDWSDLRAVLDRHALLADDWLGTSSSALVPHEEHASNVATGFGRYLIQIPFVPPSSSALAHPKRIFARIVERSTSGGTLVVGHGGVGKTRLLFEVAKLARAAGWRVLHAIIGDTPLKYDELETEILSGNGPVLVVCDYLDRLQLDIASIRRRLLPEAARRKVRVAFIASTRAHRNLRNKLEHDEFFETIPLKHDTAHAKRIVRKMRDCIAPMATRLLGKQKIEALAGERPIIALFTFLELERKSKDGRLDEHSLPDMRDGEIMPWLRRRLHDDHLTVEVPSSPLETEMAEPSVIAAATVLAAAPARHEDLSTLALSILRCLKPDNSNYMNEQSRADRIVTGLRELGWFDENETGLSVVHDVVTDHIVADVLRNSNGHLREEALWTLLAPAARSPRLLGRFTLALRRLSAGTSSFELALLAGLERWIESNASDIGYALEAATSLDASYAVNALFDGSPWTDSALKHWNHIIEPWISRHGNAHESWPAYFRILPQKALSREGASRIVQAATSWLGHHGSSEEAAMVLVTLLDRIDLDSDAESRATTAALLWHDKHSDKATASSVLGVLLEHYNLGEDVTSRVAQATLSMVGGHHDAPNAGFSLGMLIGRGDLAPELRSRAMAAAATWLAEHRAEEDAGFVLAALIIQGNVEPIADEEVVQKALTWCDIHGDKLATGFVLGALFSCNALSPTQAQHVFRKACTWIRSRDNDFEPIFALRNIFLSNDFSQDTLSEMADTALNWLKKYGEYPQSYMTLLHLLQRTDLDAPMSLRLEDAALSWCQVCDEPILRAIILCSLVERSSLSSTGRKSAIQMAVPLLTAHSEEPTADAVVLAVLLACWNDLDDEIAQRVISDAVAWLDQHGSSDGAGFVLAGILNRTELTTDIYISAQKHALSWLEQRRDRLEAALALQPLIRRNDLRGDTLEHVCSVALEWLRRHGRSWVAVVVIQHIFAREDLKPTLAKQFTQLSLRWLGHHGRRLEAGAILQRLSASKQADIRNTIAEFIDLWLRDHSHRPDAVGPLSAILHQTELDNRATKNTINIAIEWINKHTVKLDTYPVIRALLIRPDLSKIRTRDRIAVAAHWLEHNDKSREAVAILIPMLQMHFQHIKVPTATKKTIIKSTFAWLGEHQNEEVAGTLLHLLILRADLDREDVKVAVRACWLWIKTHDSSDTVDLVLHGLSSRLDLEPNFSRRVIRAAFSLLKLRPHVSTGAALLLATLIGRRDLAREYTHRAVTKARAWLKQYADLPEVDALLYALLDHDVDAKSSKLTRTLRTALVWLGRHVRSTPTHILFDYLFINLPQFQAGRRFLKILAELALSEFKKVTKGDMRDIIIGLPPLLALAACARSSMLKREVRAFAVTALRRSGALRSDRSDLAVTCYRFVEAGAWPNAQTATQTLNELGLKQPNQLRQT